MEYYVAIKKEWFRICASLYSSSYFIATENGTL